MRFKFYSQNLRHSEQFLSTFFVYLLRGLDTTHSGVGSSPRAVGCAICIPGILDVSIVSVVDFHRLFITPVRLFKFC